MDVRTEYCLTLSTPLGKEVIRQLVAYHERMREPLVCVGDIPSRFSVPGVLLIENLLYIESHKYEVVPNEAYQERTAIAPNVDEPPLIDINPRVLHEKTCLRVQFVVWQRMIIL